MKRENLFLMVLLLMLFFAVDCSSGGDEDNNQAPCVLTPRVAKVFPANKSTDVPANVKITVEFSENVQDSVGAAITITYNEGVKVGGWASYYDKKLVFTPDENLKPGEVYTIYIPAHAVINEDGEEMEDDFKTTFTVATEDEEVDLKDKYVRLVSSRVLPDHRVEYKIALWKEAIPISVLAEHPFIAGDFNSWQTENIVDDDCDGYYEATIITYDRYLYFNYGGDRSKNSWADVSESKFFDKNKGTLLIGFCKGSIYLHGEAPFSNKPGITGDDWLRSETVNGRVVIYLNNNKVPGSVDKPFCRGNFTNWDPVDQIISDSSGWGKIETGRTNPVTLELNYGGDYTKDSYADMSGSTYYDSIKQILIVAVP
ncbi:MAG: Ig-like domain-containing protein [Patescibacteria group bacterium]|jgi:methionine-rich copper-binding protein CopC